MAKIFLISYSCKYFLNVNVIIFICIRKIKHFWYLIRSTLILCDKIFVWWIDVKNIHIYIFSITLNPPDDGTEECQWNFQSRENTLL